LSQIEQWHWAANIQIKISHRIMRRITFSEMGLQESAIDKQIHQNATTLAYRARLKSIVKQVSAQ
jgi:hypothetical protein